MATISMAVRLALRGRDMGTYLETIPACPMAHRTCRRFGHWAGVRGPLSPSALLLAGEAGYDPGLLGCTPEVRLGVKPIGQCRVTLP